jgi:hypothetical protein
LDFDFLKGRDGGERTFEAVPLDSSEVEEEISEGEEKMK